MNRVKILLKHKKDLINIEVKISDDKLLGVFRDRKKQTESKEVLGGFNSKVYEQFLKDPMGFTASYAKVYISKNYEGRYFRDFKIITIDSRGGKRENAGRKEQPDKVKTSISIEKKIYDYIDNYSENTFSGSLEDLIEEVMGGD